MGRLVLSCVILSTLSAILGCGGGGAGGEDPPPTSVPCPTAVISVTGESLLEPFATVQLDGTPSTSPAGSITEYLWTVVAHPAGYIPRFDPSDRAPTPTLRLDLVGLYTVELAVRDAGGRTECSVDQVVLEASVDAAIYVELVWVTAGDPDPTDTGLGVGADMDLHLQHPSAVGVDVDGDSSPDGWFDALYDCDWSNPNPDWGVFGTDEDPELARDDPDGAGPEVVRIDGPQDGTYRVGVHAFDDHAFGPSEVMVRIFVDGVVKYESPYVELATSDLWQVADVGWPSGAVTPVEDPPGLWDIVSGVSRP